MSPTGSTRCAPISRGGGASTSRLGRSRTASSTVMSMMTAAIFLAGVLVLRVGGEAVAPEAATAGLPVEECNCEGEVQRATADLSSLKDRLSKAEEAREDADRRASDAERMLEKEIDLSKDILAKASKRVEDLEGQLEESGAELGVCTEGRASDVADLRTEVKELRDKLERSEAETRENSSNLESKLREVRAKLERSESERDEAVRAESEGRKQYDRVVTIKDAKIADLREELDEMETKERKARDLLRHAHDERGEAQRRVAELTRTLRDREEEAGRHVCNLTLAAEMVGESTGRFTVWARESTGRLTVWARRGATEGWVQFRRWSAPHVAAAGREARVVMSWAAGRWDECVERSGRFLAPHTEAFMGWYADSGMKEIVAAKIISPYEEHVSPLLRKLLTRGREIVESGRLIAVSSVEEASRWALARMEKRGREEKKSKGGWKVPDTITSYLSNVPMKVVEALRYTESHATEVVSRGFWILCCLLVLPLCQPLLWFVLSILLLPFRLFMVILGFRGRKRGHGAKVAKQKRVPHASDSKVANGGKRGRSGQKPTNGKKF